MINIYNQLSVIVGPDNIKKNEPMKKHTSFKVGGNADILIMPSSVNQISDILKICNNSKTPFIIIGNGSNLLVRDNGIKGVVIKISKNLNNISIENDIITAEAGAILPSIAQLALKNSLAGFEFAAGIPGTLGGAIAMNAGAHGGEMKDIVVDVTVMDYKGNVKILTNKDMEFSYRNSILSSENYIILSTRMKLIKGDQEKIKENMDTYKEKRISSQPLNFPSAGSTFKRVRDVSVGKILQDLNLKGLSLNGAQVSKKHGGFIINTTKETTAQDILTLIDLIKIIVKTKQNITLEEEVKIIGEE